MMDDFKLINRFSVLSEQLVDNKIDKETFKKEVDLLANLAALPIIGEKLRVMGQNTIADFEYHRNKRYLYNGNMINISDSIVSEEFCD